MAGQPMPYPPDHAADRHSLHQARDNCAPLRCLKSSFHLVIMVEQGVVTLRYTTTAMAAP